jgi:cyanate lyase
MNTPEITERLLAAKKQKGLSFAELGKTIGRDEVWVAALLYRQASASEEEAQKLSAALDLGQDAAEALTEFPVKGLGTVVPSDPLLYRFHEILQVYGMPLKAVIHEKFGDGIMSAVDLTLTVHKEHTLKGERVRVTLSGKFLPYKKW